MPNSLQSQDSVPNPRGTMRAPSLFGTLPTALQASLRAGAVRRNFADGQLVCQRGDAPDGFWIVEKGLAKVGNYDGDGQMQTLIIIGPGGSFGELACMGAFTRVVDVEAMGELETTWVSDRQLQKLIDTSPDAARALLRTLAAQLQDAVNGLFELRNVSAPKRMVRRLLILSSGQAAPVKLKIKQQELAELVGVSRMTVGSTLTELEQSGLISRQYGHIIVEDPVGLRAWMRS